MKEASLYKIVRPIITCLFKIIYRPTIIGKDKIPSTGRIILAGNHTNNLDCLLLISTTKRTIHFLAKKELLKIPFGFIFRGMGIIPVDRSIHDKEALQGGIDILNHDKVIGIFPEGTINRTEDIILPFKIGAIKMSSLTGSKIIPFTITGKYKLWNNNLKIEFLDSIVIPESKDLTTYNNKLMNIISKNLKKENK